MTHDERKNLRKLSLVRGGLYGTRSQCQRDVQANVYALRAARQQKGRVMPWGIHTVAEGKTAPTGEPEKLMDRLKRVGCSLARTRTYVGRWRRRSAQQSGIAACDAWAVDER